MSDSSDSEPILNCPYDDEPEEICNEIIPIKDFSKCLSLNGITITYGIFNNRVYINLTELCKAGGKSYKAWKRLDATEEFLRSLELVVLKSTGDFIIYNDNGNQDRATWGIPQIAINIAYWLSPEFQVQVTKWIYELGLMGKVELGNERSLSELDSTLLDQAQNKILELEGKLKTAHHNNKLIMYNHNDMEQRLENSEGHEKCLKYDYEMLNRRFANLECDYLNMQHHYNVLRMEAKQDLYEPIRDKNKNRSYMMYVLMQRYFDPVYVKAIKLSEIIKKFPNTPGFENWYKLNTLCNFKKKHIKEEKSPKKKIAHKKAKGRRKIELSDSDESDLEDAYAYTDGDDESDLSDNDLTPSTGDNFTIYKKRTDSTKKRFYTISMKHHKGTKYSAILYTESKYFKPLIEYFKQNDIYSTPDPNVFCTSISTIDACLRKLYIKI
jgi:hypothetical protein